MPCDFDRIDALVAGTLPEEKRAAMLTHMKNCTACRTYYEAMSALEGSETAPEGFTQRVMDAVLTTPQQKARRSQRRLWSGIAGVAACAVLVVGLGFGSGLLATGRFAAESVNDSAPGLARDYDGDAALPEGDSLGGDDAAIPSDLLLPIHTLTEPDLCADIRAWLAQEGIPALYGEEQREAYELTADQAATLNQTFPAAALPAGPLQLELKGEE